MTECLKSTYKSVLSQEVQDSKTDLEDAKSLFCWLITVYMYSAIKNAKSGFKVYNHSSVLSRLFLCSLDVEGTVPSSNPFQKCISYTFIHILAEVSHDVEHTAPSSIFSR